MVELEACGRKFRIRKIDSLNLVVEEYREPRSNEPEKLSEAKWIRFGNYFQTFVAARRFIRDKVEFDAVGNDDEILTLDEYYMKVD